MTAMRAFRPSTFRDLLSAGLVLTAVMAIPSFATAEIVPHEARYRLQLESLYTDEGFPLEASGVMAVRMERDCQKWTLIRELQFDVAMEGASSINLETRVRILEGIDEKRMEFAGWQSESPNARRVVKGKATMNSDGYGGTAYFQGTEETYWELPSPTKLPIAAREDLLDALSAGETDPQSLAFQVFGISEVVRTGPGKMPNLDIVDTENLTLLRERSWRVERAVYFETIARNEPFMLETLQIHRNGVVSRFWRDYQTVILSGELVALEEIPEPDC